MFKHNQYYFSLFIPQHNQFFISIIILLFNFESYYTVCIVSIMLLFNQRFFPVLCVNTLFYDYFIINRKCNSQVINYLNMCLN